MQVTGYSNAEAEASGLGAGHPFPLEDKIEAVSTLPDSMTVLQMHLPCCHSNDMLPAASSIPWCGA